MKGRDMALARDVALLHLVLIKPTHYDDDGYPIQWLRSAIPSNTLACLNGWRRTRDGGTFWDPMSLSGCTPLMKPIDVCIQGGSFATSSATAGGR
jgi:hypothetical protein